MIRLRKVLEDLDVQTCILVAYWKGFYVSTTPGEVVQVLRVDVETEIRFEGFRNSFSEN